MINAQVADAGTYVVVITDTYGSATSDGKVLTVTPATPVAVTSGAAPASSTVAEGTNFTLSTTVTGSGPITYQWYTQEGPNAIVPGATTANYTNLDAEPVIAPPLTSKNGTNHYYMIATGPQNTATSAVATVFIAMDHKGATLTLKTPANKGIYGSTFVAPGKAWAIEGLATDQTTPNKGHIAHVIYWFTNYNALTPIASGPFEAVITNKAANTGDTIQGFYITNNTPLPGTNVIAIWPVDLAGNLGKGVTNTFFYQVQMPVTLYKTGDGTGSVTFKTKMGDKVNTSNVIYFAAGTVSNAVNLNVGETYTLSYIPDRTTNNLKNLPSVISVLTNAPGMNVPPGPQLTNTIKKYIGADITVQSNMSAVNFEFDRDRFVDMAGNYNAVFTADLANPTINNSRFLHMVVTKSRKASGYLMDSAKFHDNFPAPAVSFEASGYLNVTTLSGIVISGSLDWGTSDDTNGVKQFIGNVALNATNASVIADQENKYALPTAGLATMSIPGVNNNPGGSGYATLKLTGGNISANYLLGDDDKHAASWPMKGSRSGNVPQWIVTKTGVLFGNIVTGDGLTNVSAPSLSWVRGAPFTPYSPNLLPSGFVNSPFAAICSPYDGNGMNGSFTVNLSGGNLTNDISQPITLAAGTTASIKSIYTSMVGPVTLAKVDPNGKLTVTFLDGLPGKHKTTGTGVVLQNATNGLGFFIRQINTSLATNSGSIVLTNQ